MQISFQLLENQIPVLNKTNRTALTSKKSQKIMIITALLQYSGPALYNKADENLRFKAASRQIKSTLYQRIKLDLVNVIFLYICITIHSIKS